MEVRHIPLIHRTLTAQFYPASHSPCPVVVFLPDLFGIVDSLKETAQALSLLGFHVLVPDLYSGTNGARYCVRMLFDKLCRNNEPGAEPLIEIHQILDYARQLPEGVPGRIGVIGQCLTGGFILHMALRDDVVAPVVFHHSLGLSGSGIPASCASRIEQKVQGHFVHFDPYCPKARVEQLKAQMGDHLDVEYYRGIPHGIPHFFRSHPEGRRAWDRMVGFLHHQLEPLHAPITEAGPLIGSK